MYLEVGHCIENKIKNKALHFPSDFGRYTREARIRAVEPYDDKDISYSFVKDYGLASMVELANSSFVNLFDFPQLRQVPIKIKYTNWQHLQQLKGVIPSDCGPYYDHLPHEEKPIKETKEVSVTEKG
ncbi:hypothetical protein JTB14_032111 [Gonioctena quinquepunctata]|nr:hypothetical protein JTB14_032111 [Gonioctena quinquepunctata]